MLYTLLITYVLGGLTFIPLLAALVILYYATLPVEPKPSRPATVQNAPEVLSTVTRTPTLKAWLTARHTFDSSPSTYISLVRTLLDARSQHPRRAEDAYYAVLKGSILYLYEEESMHECTAAIDIARCDVRVFPDDDLLDGELFAKRNAIRLIKHDFSTTTSTSDREPSLLQKKSNAMSNDTDPPVSHTSSPWYLFFRSVTVMEDWYLALLAARHPAPSAPFPHAAQKALITSLDALPDLIPTRWLNALLGRLFLGVKGTTAVESWVIGRLMKKLSKVKKPGFLTNVVVRSFDAGDAVPVLSKPMLKELTQEGEASVGVDVSYLAPPGGEMRITISATATISLPTTPSFSILSFSSRNKDRDGDKDGEKHSEKDRDNEKEKDHTQKPYEVSLVLAIVLRRVEGNLLFKIKPPPSNRIWYAFTTMPHMEVSVEPVVSDRQIRWGMVLSVIEGKLKEIIQESVVLPYMDDIPFFDTTSYKPRGGLFGDVFPAQGRDAAAPVSEQMEATPMPTLTPKTPAPSAATDTEDLGPGEAATDPHADAGAGRAPRAHSADVLLDRGEGEQTTEYKQRKRRPWSSKRDHEPHADSEELADESDRPPGYWNGSEPARVTVTQDKGDADAEEAQRPMSADSRASSASDEWPVSTSAPTGIAGLSTSAPTPSTTMIPSLPRSPRPTTLSSRNVKPGSPRPKSSSPGPTTPHATSSFFSTLKSRSAGIAEKQPMLKEAMRKWGAGVNWAAGLRKEKEGDGDGVLKDRDAETGALVDHGGMLGLRSASHGLSPMGSYADLRKKVEKREKDRERDRGGDGIVGAIHMPVAERDTEDDWVSERRRSSSLHSETSSIRKMTSSGGLSYLTPSASRATTELHVMAPIASGSGSETPPPTASPRASERRGSEQLVTSAAFPLVEDVPIPTPIRAQPKAATMTIPGIHEKHRGAVMALGSEFVDGSGAQTSDGEGQHTAGSRTIQSVYRLLRGGGAGGEGQGQGNAGESESGRNISLTSTSVPHPTAKQSPPPLPPRTRSQKQLYQIRQTDDSAVEPASSSPFSDREDDAGLSLASQALKSLAQQDSARLLPPTIPVRRDSLMLRDTLVGKMDRPGETAAPPSFVIPSLDGVPNDESDTMRTLPPPSLPLSMPASDEKERWNTPPPLPPRKSSSFSTAGS